MDYEFTVIGKTLIGGPREAGPHFVHDERPTHEETEYPEGYFDIIAALGEQRFFGRSCEVHCIRCEARWPEGGTFPAECGPLSPSSGG